MGLANPLKGGKPVPLYYSNPDIIYANEFPAPRFGQGCFAAALNACYAAVRPMLVFFDNQSFRLAATSTACVQNCQC